MSRAPAAAVGAGVPLLSALALTGVFMLALLDFQPRNLPRGAGRMADVDLVEVPGGTLRPGAESDVADPFGLPPVDEPDPEDAHPVAVQAFALGRTEVTVDQFRRFVVATGHRTDAEREGHCFAPDDSGDWSERGGLSWRDPGFPQEGDHPAVCLSWNDARAFCAWAGLRLPSADEMRYAAGNGARATAFAWGDGWPDERAGGNVADEAARRRFPYWVVFDGFDDGHVFTAPVGSFVPNDFGLFDLSGNAAEWCLPTREDGPLESRGASWADPPFFAGLDTPVAAAEPVERSAATGFRCAASRESPEPPAGAADSGDAPPGR